MKQLLMIAVTLFATSAFACPNLSGTFQCEADPQTPGDTGKFSIQGTTEGYLTTDLDDKSQTLFPADGKTYTDESGATYVGTCTTSTFGYEINGNDPQFGAFKIVQIFSIDSNNNLKQKSVLSGDFGEGVKDYSQEATCVRL